jgi:hypothetical protein
MARVERPLARRSAAGLFPAGRQHAGRQPSLVRYGLRAMAPKAERAGPKRPQRRHRQAASAAKSRPKYDRRESRRAERRNGLSLLSDRCPAPALRRRRREVFRISPQALRPRTFQSRHRHWPATLCEISRPARQAARPRQLQTHRRCWPAILATTLYLAIQSSCDAPIAVIWKIAAAAVQHELTAAQYRRL